MTRKTLIVPVFGGLGNQMFQVAHALDLCRQTGAVPSFVDLTTWTGRVTRKWELDCFGLSGTSLGPISASALKIWIAISRRIQRIIPNINLGVFDESISPHPRGHAMRFSVCAGYWQGECFFANATDLVKETFRFPEIDLSAKGFSGETKGSIPVAVHIRRGDYVSDPIARSLHLVCDTQWYFNAIQVVREHVPSAHFMIFSDDQDWAENEFGELGDVSIVKTDPDAPAWMDMAMMSKCRHFIIANSSYSWWASYIGKSEESLVIAPQYWYRDTPTQSLPIFCKDWMLL